MGTLETDASQPDPAQLTAFIRETALRLGFAKVGVIPAQPVSAEEAARLRAWLDAGYHADMAWMADQFEKRLDPAYLMENPKSIVCVAMNYYTPDDYDPSDESALKIAKYARGTDYHEVVKDRLYALLAEIQARVPEIRGRAVTDSAPIMEKPAAVQAGLGWIGKNGLVILPGMGSWFFLGELLLDVELVYDEPFPTNHCGSCRRCMDACPTGALIAESVVDANRCIAYWTIEYKGETFPEPIQEGLSGWIFGCDICQDVCPWNIRFANPTQEEAFQPRPINRTPDAAQLLEMDEDAFRAHYRKSPVKRTKLTGLKRNVRMALKSRPAGTSEG